MARNLFAVAAALGAVAVLVAFAPAAAAGGIEVLENGRGVGNANAGVRATADDASTVWWNPAGMTRFQGHAVALAAHGIFPTSDFVDEGSWRLEAPVRIPFRGEEGSTEEHKFVPGLFTVFSLNPCWKVGLSVNAPFGYATDWGETWIGRYHGTLSDLASINLNPSIAWRPVRWFSVAVGASAMYVDAELGQAIDFGALLGVPQAADGGVTIEGDSWGFGWNVGVLFEPFACTRIGLHYRSQVEQDLEGSADFDVPAAAAPILGATGRFRDTGARTEVTFPDTAGLSIYQGLGSKWAVLADVTWTGWSTFDELRVRFSNPLEPDTVTTWDWEDTWRFALGVTFRPNTCWTFRVGAAYDQDPSPDETRTPRIPGADRIWAAAGVGYAFAPGMSIDLSYAHIFVDDAPIDLSSPSAGHLRGNVESSVEVFGLQLNIGF